MTTQFKPDSWPQCNGHPQIGQTCTDNGNHWEPYPEIPALGLQCRAESMIRVFISFHEWAYSCLYPSSLHWVGDLDVRGCGWECYVGDSRDGHYPWSPWLVASPSLFSGSTKRDSTWRAFWGLCCSLDREWHQCPFCALPLASVLIWFELDRSTPIHSVASYCFLLTVFLFYTLIAKLSS